MRTIHATPIVAAMLSVTLASCGGSDGTSPIPTPTVTTVTVSASVSTVAVGGTSQLSFVAKDASGTVVPGQTASWSSQTAATARVNASGLVTAQAVGATLMTATVGTVTGTTLITVTPGSFPAAANVSTASGNIFTPNEADIAAGGSVTWAFAGVGHNVTFASGVTGTPSNISVSTNTTVSRTFSTAGTFGYVCTIHAGMSGTVFVH